MEKQFEKVRNYLLDLNISIVNEYPADGILIVNQEANGINNLVLTCDDPILVMEQLLFELNDGRKEIYVDLLKKNREIIHGAFVLDETGTKVIFRDTLQIQTLDLPELEASIHSLSLVLSEYADSIISFSKN